MKKFISMLLLVAIFQTGIYMYLDRIMLVPSASFSQKPIAEASKLQVDPQKISTDRKYYVTIQSTTAKFYTTDNRLKRKISLKPQQNITYFSWVPDTDIALIGISSNTSRGTSVTLKPVNLETNSHPVEPRISGLARGSKIKDVAFSAQVNVTYIMVKGQYNSSVYRTDANNHLRRVLNNSSVQKIAAFQSEDMLLYDSNKNGSVYALNNKGKRMIVSPSIGKYALIGTDKNDNIYIGRLSSQGIVSAILKGTLGGQFTNYKTLTYPYPVASITINYDGKLQLT